MHPNPIDFNTNTHKFYEISNRWFNANLRSLNFEKTQYIQFTNKITHLLVGRLDKVTKQFQTFVIQNFLV